MTSERSIVAPDWSRDGRFVVYSRGASGTGSDLWTVRINGEPKPQVLLATRHNEASATFSPDGRWIAYQSNSSGRSEVYVCRFLCKGDQFQFRAMAGGRRGGAETAGRSSSLSLDGSMMSAGIDTTNGFAATVPTRLFTTDLRPSNNRPYA